VVQRGIEHERPLVALLERGADGRAENGSDERDSSSVSMRESVRGALDHGEFAIW